MSLAAALGIKVASLTQILYRVPEPERYEEFLIPKRSGGQRVIAAPSRRLRFVQRRLAEILQELYAPKRNAHGFIRGRSIRSNASPHVRARWVFNVDLQGFFPSINFGRVLGLFQAPPFELPRSVAVTLAQLCCHKGALPQGAPTSPVISNLICRSLDRTLRRLARFHGCEYTRFADDITFSTRRPHFPTQIGAFDLHGESRRASVGRELGDAIESAGFTVHQSKVRLLPRRVRQEVTGLVVNQRANVPRSFVRQVRSMLHAWEKFGLQAAQAEWTQRFDRKHRPGGKPISYARVVAGKLAFLKMVRGARDPLYQRLRVRLARLLDEPTELDALWVLESESRSLQATGFVLAPYGLITNQHALAEDLVAFKPNTPNERHRVLVRCQDRDLDLAICVIEGISEPVALAPSKARIQIGSQIRLLGFPNWSRGHSHADHPGTVTKVLVDFRAASITLSCPIIAGNSGGPVLDTSGQVVAIARRGVPDNMSPNHESIAVLVEVLERWAAQVQGDSA